MPGKGIGPMKVLREIMSDLAPSPSTKHSTLTHCWVQPTV